jgi:Uma2 family endonuclease
MSTQPVPFLTPEQYLEIERAAERKSEYLNGEMFAMAGTSTDHNLVVSELILQLGPQIRSRGCRFFHQDVRVRITATGLYTYPDFAIVCGKPELVDSDTLLNPTTIIEVLSPSTEAYDRGKKFEHYRTIPTLRQYGLVAQDRMSVHVISLPDMKMEVFTQPDDVVTLHPGVQVRLADLYQDIVT